MRKSLPALALLVLAPFARAATISTIDEPNFDAEVVSFDGHELHLIASSNHQPTTRPIEDITHITLRSINVTTPSPPAVAASPTAADTTPAPAGDATPKPRRVPRRMTASTQPAAPTPEPSTAPTSQPVATTGPTTRTVTMDPYWRLKFVNGDALHGTLTAWSEGHMSIRPDVVSKVEVSFADNTVDWLWHGDTMQQARAQGLLIPRGNDDVAFVRKETNSEVVAVHGTAVGIEGDSLVFRYGDADKKIALSRLVGVTFAQRKNTPDSAFHQVIRFTDGEQLTGQWKSLQHQTLVLSAGGVDVSVPFGQVGEIDVRNGRQVFVSDLTPSKVEQTPYFDRLIPYQTDTSLSGGAIKLTDNSTAAKGVAVHSRCVLEYDLGGVYAQFKSKFGFEAGNTQGRVAVRVLGDGRVLFENADARGTDKPAMIDVSVVGVNKLTLEVDFGEGQDVQDRVVWAQARLVKPKAQ